MYYLAPILAAVLKVFEVILVIVGAYTVSLLGLGLVFLALADGCRKSADRLENRQRRNHGSSDSVP